MGWDPGYLAAFVLIMAILLETVVMHIVLPMLARYGALRETIVVTWYRWPGYNLSITVLLCYILIQLSTGYEQL